MNFHVSTVFRYIMLTISNDLNISLLLVLRFKIESRLQGSEELRINILINNVLLFILK